MMIEEDFCLHKLVLRDIRPTAIRVLVLRTLLEMKQAMSVSRIWRLNSILSINPRFSEL